MNYNNNISQLGMGFGAHKNNTQEMVDYAISHGMNYFEVATFYLDSKCEEIASNALQKYPRESYYLCDKLSILREFNNNFNIEEFFNNQLKKCKTDYFDVYLLQGVNKSCLKTIKEHPEILEFLDQQKEKGIIKKIGFSFHDTLDVLKSFMSLREWDVVQIQINFFDWYNGQAKLLYNYLSDFNIPIIAMEPCKGGNSFRQIPAQIQEYINNNFPNKNFYQISLTFLQQLKNIKVILTGAANLYELEMNINTINSNLPFTAQDKKLCNILVDYFNKNNYIPCTGCYYCQSVCPKDIQIKDMFFYSNNIMLGNEKEKNQNNLIGITKNSDRNFYHCINCKKCEKICPQQLPIQYYFWNVVKKLEM